MIGSHPLNLLRIILDVRRIVLATYNPDIYKHYIMPLYIVFYSHSYLVSHFDNLPKHDFLLCSQSAKFDNPKALHELVILRVALCHPQFYQHQNVKRDTTIVSY